MYNQYTDKNYTLVPLNEGITLKDLDGLRNVVYALIPDKPIKEQGMIKVQIGMAFKMSIIHRTIAHTTIMLGKGNPTDKALSNDIDNTLYIKILGQGYSNEEEARKAECILTSQYAYNVCEYKTGASYDIVRILPNFKGVREKMYNRVIDRPNSITRQNKAEITREEYSDVLNFEEDLIRLGVISDYKKVI